MCESDGNFLKGNERIKKLSDKSRFFLSRYKSRKQYHQKQRNINTPFPIFHFIFSAILFIKWVERKLKINQFDFCKFFFTQKGGNVYLHDNRTFLKTYLRNFASSLYNSFSLMNTLCQRPRFCRKRWKLILFCYSGCSNISGTRTSHF